MEQQFIKDKCYIIYTNGLRYFVKQYDTLPYPFGYTLFISTTFKTINIQWRCRFYYYEGSREIPDKFVNVFDSAYTHFSKYKKYIENHNLPFNFYKFNKGRPYYDLIKNIIDNVENTETLILHE